MLTHSLRSPEERARGASSMIARRVCLSAALSAPRPLRSALRACLCLCLCLYPTAPHAEPGPQRAAEPAAPAAPAAPTLHPVGKWPEGVVEAGGELWVAESGARQVSRYSLQGKRLERYRVGRLPVDLLKRPGQEVWVSVVSDHVVKRLGPRLKLARKVARMPDYTEAIAADEEHLYGLVWPGGSSSTSALFRRHLTTGAEHMSADLGQNAFCLALSAGLAWVGLDGGVVAVDTRTLAPFRRLTLSKSERALHMATTASRLYVVSLNMSSQRASVSLLPREALRPPAAPPPSGEGAGEVEERPLGDLSVASAGLEEGVAALAAWEDLVVVSLRSGALLALDPLTLHLLHRWPAPSVGGTGAQAIERAGGRLWVTAHAGAGGVLVEVPLGDLAK